MNSKNHSSLQPIMDAGNLQTPHESEIDQIHNRQLAAKDAEIERLKRDLVDAVQNIQAHSMIVDASEKDAEIEHLKTVLRALIAKLDAISANQQFQGVWAFSHIHGGKYTGPNWVEELQRAREAAR